MSKVAVDGGDGIQSLNFALNSSTSTVSSITTTNKPFSSSSSSSSSSNKRLFFDRRYGWVYDEWTEPSEEALAGGRGMFCILPLANNFVKVASQSVMKMPLTSNKLLLVLTFDFPKINHVSSFVVKVLEKPEEFSPQALQASLNENLQKLASSVQPQNVNLFKTIKKDSSIISSGCLEHIHQDSSDSNNG